MIALITISDGRGHLTNAVRSLLDNTEPGTFAKAIMVDDAGISPELTDGGPTHHTDEAFALLHEHMPVTLRCHAERRGGAAAIQTAWSLLAESGCDYAFHLEEDWTFPGPVPVAEMCAMLDEYPTLANVVLKRQPWGHEGGTGYVNENYHDTKANHLWHVQGFWLNPCVYPTEITTLGWPDHGHEHDFTKRCLDAGFEFAVYGKRDDPPRAIHVGTERHPSWTW